MGNVLNSIPLEETFTRFIKSQNCDLNYLVVSYDLMRRLDFFPFVSLIGNILGIVLVNRTIKKGVFKFMLVSFVSNIDH